MSSSIFLVVVYLNTGAVGSMHPMAIAVKEMPTMRMCESIGAWFAAQSKSVKWTCIEGVGQ